MENKILGVLALVLGAIALIVVAIKPQSITVSNTSVPSAEQQSLGINAWETTNLTSLDLSDDLVVGGDLTVTGTVSADVLPTRSAIAMTTATTTPCAIQNTGDDRVLLGVSGIWSAAAGAGTVGLQVGTSTNQYTAGTGKLISNAAFANQSGQAVIATTSTLSSAYGIWKTNEWLVWNTVTTTNAGVCTAVSF
jgi:hypothetical protein